ncbi:MAG TPA: FkbM family methyltransferase [Anaerolineae bacterium]|nr:FkbM family methyltransferase [Anaerolineae bacterium]
MNATLKRTLRQLLPRTLKPHTIFAGPLRDYRIVTSWHDYPAAILGRTERELVEWFAQNVRAGETWLDIGAHYGYTAIALSHYVGATGRVFAFEPMLTSAGCLTQTRRLNDLAQLTVVPLGLGDARLGLERLPVVRGMVDSTLRANGHSWQETFLVAQLDEVWQEICGGNARVDGIKVDVQGMELNVLRGMKDLLRSQQPKVIVEVHAGVARDELRALLAQVGYTREAIPIESVADARSAQLLDDKSYLFLPNE